MARDVWKVVSPVDRSGKSCQLDTTSSSVLLVLSFYSHPPSTELIQVGSDMTVTASNSGEQLCFARFVCFLHSQTQHFRAAKQPNLAHAASLSR